MRVVKVEKEKLEAVSEFCFLGDMLSAGSGCELAAVLTFHEPNMLKTKLIYSSQPGTKVHRVAKHGTEVMIQT